MDIPDRKTGVSLANDGHIKCEALCKDTVGIRVEAPGIGAFWLYCSFGEATSIHAQLTEALEAAKP